MPHSAGTKGHPSDSQWKPELNGYYNVVYDEIVSQGAFSRLSVGNEKWII